MGRARARRGRRAAPRPAGPAGGRARRARKLLPAGRAAAGRVHGRGLAGHARRIRPLVPAADGAACRVRPSRHETFELLGAVEGAAGLAAVLHGRRAA